MSSIESNLEKANALVTQIRAHNRRLEARKLLVESLLENIEALRGERAHHLGCTCNASPDGIHSCATLMAAFRALTAKTS